MVDVITRFSNGSRYRERRRLTTRSKSAAQRWGEDRERHLLQYGLPQPKKEVPTLEQFAPKFLDGYARANRQKPSGIAVKTTVLNVHLVPTPPRAIQELAGHQDLALLVASASPSVHAQDGPVESIVIDHVEQPEEN